MRDDIHLTFNQSHYAGSIHPLPPSGYYPYLSGRASYETLRQQTVPLRQVGRGA